MPAKDFVYKAAQFSEGKAYRYSLLRSKFEEQGLVSLCFVLLNPSTADAVQDDPTIRRCAGFAERFGYRAFVVVNRFAYRATDPDVLRSCIRQAGIPSTEGEDNQTWVSRYVSQSRRTIVGWGNFGYVQPWVTDLLNQHHKKVYHFGLTGRGQPKHPLYLPKDAELYPWEPTT